MGGFNERSTKKGDRYETFRKYVMPNTINHTEVRLPSRSLVANAMGRNIRRFLIIEDGVYMEIDDPTIEFTAAYWEMLKLQQEAA